ncbi:MAG: hypothetical protein M4D80_11275 [Myxococcota bacterium]|nr:hypothetical protein [Deltaproteobacteria bacterium]MDQ3335739.1 hypothetical protein [Myxococcota bacterium]
MASLLDLAAASPDDDGPRLVWADAVGGERGEFVVIQCALARGELPPADSSKLRRRQRELLQAHGKAWSELAGIATHVTFHRGFVEAAAIDTGRFVDEANDIFRRAPLLRSLSALGLATRDDATPVARERLETLFGSHTMRRLEGLYIQDPEHVVEYESGQYLHETGYDVTSYGRDALELAATATHLRAFGMQGRAPLHEATFLSRVERLWPFTYETNLVALVAKLPALTAIELTSHELIRHLPTTLRELGLRLTTSAFHDDKLEMLAAAPCAGSLERLALTSASLSDVSALGRLPRLRSLCLREVSLGTSYNPPLDRFLATLPDMPALRELRVFSNLRPDSGRLVAERYGAQLELLDLRSAHNLHDQKLDHLVAGDIMRGFPSVYLPLLCVGGNAPAPFWEETCIAV